MKKYRGIAAALAVVLAVSALTGCGKKKIEENSNMTVYSSQIVGEKEIYVAINEEASENDTVFRLNSVVDSGVRTTMSDGGAEKNIKYIYVNATIKNTSDVDYSLSYLNNFELILPDGSSILPHMRTYSYGEDHYANFAPTPFTVPAGGEFTGYICGFEVEESVQDFTICFYPTQNNNNKTTVVKVDISESDIADLPEDK